MKLDIEKVRRKIGLFLLRHPNFLPILIGVISLLMLGILTYAIFRDLTKSNSPKYSYAIFAADALIANCLFNLCRSNLFLERYGKSKEQWYVYNAAVLFLSAAMITILTAAIDYSEFYLLADASLSKSQTFNYMILATSAFLLLTSFVCSIIGTIQFFRWANIASKKHAEEIDDKMKREGYF